MYLIQEESVVVSEPKIKKSRDKITMEVVLQTASEFNRNRRRYPKSVLEESINRIMERVKEGSLLGELDHPIDSNPARQVTVSYKEASHKIRDIGWDGNKLKGVIETLAATSNGRALRDLVVLDKVPVGFSYRGMGDLRPVMEGGMTYYEVKGPLNTVTWDSVSFPSHAAARLVKVTESDYGNMLEEAKGCILTEEGSKIFYERDGLICTSEGFCYLPNVFDKLVEQRVLQIQERYRF